MEANNKESTSSSPSGIPKIAMFKESEHDQFKQRKRSIIKLAKETQDSPSKRLPLYITTRPFDENGIKMNVDILNPPDTAGGEEEDDPDKTEYVIDCSCVEDTVSYIRVKHFRKTRNLTIVGARFKGKVAMQLRTNNLKFVDCVWETPEAVVVHSHKIVVSATFSGASATNTARFKCFDVPSSPSSSKNSSDTRYPIGIGGSSLLAALLAARLASKASD